VSEAPLNGFKVADFSQGVAGPHCAMLLAQHGAEVIKVEPPEGDWGRRIGPLHGDFCADAIAWNRGKRSIALDLKAKEGAEVAHALACEADVVIESFRPGIMKKFGLDYASIRAANPDAVYLSITGFGQNGPYSDRPATDIVLQAFCGLMSANLDAEGRPQRLNLIAIDIVTGLYGSQAVLAALLRVVRTREGAYLDCSLMQSAAAFQAGKLVEQQLDGGAPPFPQAPVGVMKAADGYIAVAIRSDEQFTGFCRFIGREDLARDPRFMPHKARLQNQRLLLPIVQAEFPKRTVAAWAAALSDIGAHNAPVLGYGDFMGDEHVRAVNAVAWAEQPGIGRVPFARVPGASTEAGRLSRSPRIGEHGVEILCERGFAPAEIEALIARKVLHGPQS
jgi:crotonobetainyl-CoA:carnitine CoA-transferase CaiB-like acyl-CoA transferase